MFKKLIWFGLVVIDIHTSESISIQFCNTRIKINIDTNIIKNT